MGKIKGFLFAVRHREILMTDLGLYLFGLKALTNYSKNYTLLFHDGKICQKYAILRYVS